MKKKTGPTHHRDIERWLNEGGRDLSASHAEPRVTRERERDAKLAPRPRGVTGEAARTKPRVATRQHARRR